MNELKIVETDIDWIEIVNLALNRQGWGQEHVLYTYGNINVKCVLDTYDFTNNCATFKMKVDYPYKGETSCSFHCENYEYISLWMNSFSIENFKSLMNRRVEGRLKAILRAKLREEARELYKDLYYYESYSMIEKYAQEANLTYDYNKVLAIIDKDIREKCMDAFSEKIVEILNGPFNDKIEEYVNNAKCPIPKMQQLIDNIVKNREVKK